MKAYTLGLDFGTESARAVLVEVATGQTVSTAVEGYPDGVLDQSLPGSSEPLPPDWALQNPRDWLSVLEKTVRAVLKEARVSADSVIGLGIDFTACTVLPVRADGTPLCQLDQYQGQPHAWPKLWKHHATQPQADRINALAASRGEPWAARYGGKLSAEWLLPKALQILEEAPEIYAASDRIVEGADWVVWQLTGNLVRNACTAGYKATWHKTSGFPSQEFLRALHPQLVDLFSDKLQGPIRAPGQPAGQLLPEWAARLGLAERVQVAVPIIDAHAAVIGGGVTGPDILFMIMGTSTCHLLMSTREVLVPGIAGVVEDGIVPGLFGYEAGQAAVGDIFAWFVRQAVPSDYQREAEQQGCSIHDLLSRRGESLAAGESGLLALDWWNGNRSTLVDADLSGLLLGCTLSTRPEEIYRALIESTAFGTRTIIEAFTELGLPVESIVSGGGLTKNRLLMQIYADITGRRIQVAGAPQASALGAAILAAVAAGPSLGGYAGLPEAASRMTPPPRESYHPRIAEQEIYQQLYLEYRRLYDYFGRGENPVMKRLRELRRRNEGPEGKP